MTTDAEGHHTYNRRLPEEVMRRAGLVVLFAIAAARPALADEGSVCADAAESGQKFRDKGHFVESRELFAKCARKECPKLVRDDCLSFLDQLRKRMPSIVVRVTDAAHHDVTSFRILKDGKLLLDKPSGTAIDVDPGEATLHVEADGFAPRDLPVVVAEGEQRRLVEIVLAPPGAPLATTAKPIEVPPPASSSGPGAATFVAGGVGVAGLAVFGVFQAIAQPRYSTDKQGCYLTHSCKDAGALQTQFDVSMIGLGIGGAGVATAIILYLAVDRHAKTSPQSARFTPAGIRF